MFQENTTSNTLIGLMRESNWTMRSIASVVILTFGGLVTSPAVAAVEQEVKEIQWHKTDASNAAKLSKKVEETHAFLTKLAAHDAKTLDLAASHEQLRALKSDLESLDKGTMDDFAANEAHIKAHKLPAVIEQRQQDAVKTYRSRMDTLMAELKAADTAKDVAGFMTHVAAAKAHLDKVQVKPFHAKFDPKNLPFSVAKPTDVKPRLTKQDYKNRPVAPAKRAQVAANGPLAGILTAADVTGALPTNPSDPSYVAATDDVQITPAIQAQAAALHNDPVQIYNWVHNNVEYVPTYGSIQGSDMTLQTLKGNDFDQASLLIALLRASNIPSRYVYGTVQVPIAQVENWVGGVTDPNAALNLMSQGGIPVTGLVQGGQIKYAQLEHVWVEAWVDFVPSRAAKSGAGNTWAPLDASFKQYIYTQGLDFQHAVPFDANSLTQHLASSVSVNSATGAVTNIDASSIQQQISNYQTQLSNYINSLPQGTTVSQVIGGKAISQITSDNLSASLPYAVHAVAQRTTSIDPSLATKFQYELDDEAGNAVVSYSASTPDLASSTIALSFIPATQADEDLITSYFPPPNSDGSPTSIGQFPTNLPGYLINLKAQIVINGVVVSTGSAFPLGTQLTSTKGYWTPKANWVLDSKPVTVGQYQAIALDLQGLSPQMIANIQQRMQSTINTLNGGDIEGLSPDDLTGDILQAGVVSIFAVNDQMNTVNARVQGLVDVRAPSFGTLSTVAQTEYSFGVPVAVTFPSILMDIDHSEDLVISKDNDSAKAISFVENAGVRLSTYEHVIPEQIVNAGNSSPVQGASAMSIILAAQAEGQSIYAINQENLTAALSALNQSDDVKTRIQDVVGAGEEVIIPQSEVTVSNWQGAGYVILDPATGSGAYEISGQANGCATEVVGWLLSVFGYWTGYKAALLSPLNPKIQTNTDAYFLSYLTVAQFCLGVLDIGYKCTGLGASATVAGYTAATEGAIGLVGWLGDLALGLSVATLGLGLVVAACLGVFLLGVILDLLIDKLLVPWLEKELCAEINSEGGLLIDDRDQDGNLLA